MTTRKTDFNKLFWRIANRIDDKLKKEADETKFIKSVEEIREQADEIKTNINKLERFCELKPCLYSLYLFNLKKKFLIRIENSIRRIVREEETCLEESEKHLENKRRPYTVKDIYKDLIALEEQYDLCLSDGKANTTVFTVRIEEVEIEGLLLGPFVIRFDFINNNYNIVSEGICSFREEYPHPHVSDGGELCTGEGALPLSSALKEGRLYDFFTTIETILETYDPEGSYCTIEGWFNSSECYECEASLNQDTEHYCKECEQHVFCEDCLCYCKCCEGAICERCISECERCSEKLCPGCIKSCSSCSDEICNNCLSSCDKCGEECCSSCLNFCNLCQEEHCSSCSICCIDCDNEKCQDCSVSCYLCNKAVCDSCKEELNEVSFCEECFSNEEERREKEEERKEEEDSEEFEFDDDDEDYDED